MAGYRTSGHSAFGPKAPHRNLPFPVNGNMTVVEILTFLPHSLKSVSVIYRLVSNSVSRMMICDIINQHRDLTVEQWLPNNCGQVMIRTMRAAGYTDWTVKTHDKWHLNQKEYWDPESISVAGFKTPFEDHGEGSEAAEPIPFKDLCNGVLKMPNRQDALDFTKMVRWAVGHPSEDWSYPTDWDRLLERVGGPAEVKREHSDAQMFKRWEMIRGNAPKAPPQKAAPREKSETPGPRGRPEKRVDPATILISEDPVIGVVDPRELGWPAPYTIKDSMEESLLPMERSRDSSPVEEYVRARAKFIQPPDRIVFPTIDDIVQAYLGEGDHSEPFPFSPYAFSGPRNVAPYRPLHCISMPNPDDVSGWAENLRWASEQNTIFGTEGWNESPEHMSWIWVHRVEGQWVSDEWLENHVKEQKQKEEEQIRVGVLRKEAKDWEGEVDYLTGGWCNCSACDDYYHLQGSRVRFEATEETPRRPYDISAL